MFVISLVRLKSPVDGIQDAFPGAPQGNYNVPPADRMRGHREQDPTPGWVSF